jgi:hypothetical protein
MHEINESASNALRILLDKYEKTGNPVPSEVVAELEYIVEHTKESNATDNREPQS